MPRGGPNQKAVAAKEKKAANQAIKDAEKQRQAEAAAAKSWNVGADLRGASKAEAAAAKADEAARKKREKVSRCCCVCTYLILVLKFDSHPYVNAIMMCRPPS